MLTTLRVRHFKAWADTGQVKLAPLTVFFGAHGSGKSSIGQALARVGKNAHAPHCPLPTETEVTINGHLADDGDAAAAATEPLLDSIVFAGSAEPRDAHAPRDATQHWLHAMGLVHAADAGPPDDEPGPSARHVQHLLDLVFGAPPAHTIWLAHPESHLHPKAQAILMDALIAAVQARQDGQALGVQCILESHSEAFLNRLQRRVAEGVIAPGDVALYVCRRHGRQAELEALRLNDLGDIENWPADLFGDDMTDIAARTLAAMRRRQASNGQGPAR